MRKESRDSLTRLSQADIGCTQNPDLDKLWLMVTTRIGDSGDSTVFDSLSSYTNPETVATTADTNVKHVDFTRRSRTVAASIAAVAAVSAIGIGTGVLVNRNANVDENITASPAVKELADSEHLFFDPVITVDSNQNDNYVSKDFKDVEFVAQKNFSSEPSVALVYKVSAAKAVSNSDISRVASSLGVHGNVEQTKSGYTVTSSNGAKLVVTVGKLTSMTFANPDAVKMVCVPLRSDDSDVELPSAVAPTPKTSGGESPKTPTPTQSATPIPQVEPTDETKPAAPPREKPVTPIPTPTETLNPPIRPIEEPEETPAPTENPVKSEDSGNNTKPDTVSKTKEKVVSPKIGSVTAGVGGTGIQIFIRSASIDKIDETQPQGDNSQVLMSQKGTSDKSKCVMRVAGKAPSARVSLEQVAKVASTLGASINCSRAQVQSSGGMSVVTAEVNMPGVNDPLLWKASVTEYGVASIVANLGGLKQIGESKVISQAEAVRRLSDPKYGPVDVYDPAGTASRKIVGKVELVSVKLTSVPVQKKDETISVPAYLITDTQGRVWTVLASE